MTRKIGLLGVPIGEGAGLAGCDAGPAAFRQADIASMFAKAGYIVRDFGDADRALTTVGDHDNAHHNRALRHLPRLSGWARSVQRAARDVGQYCDLPIFLGGDHAMALGTVPAMADRARALGRPFFVLWIDAHPDIHTLESSSSGNLHGVPMAYFTGMPGFDGFFPPLTNPITPKNVCMMGIRSVDNAEEATLKQHAFTVHRMRDLLQTGVRQPLQEFLRRVAAVNGVLHVSFDVDGLDPLIAPAVGTAVEAGIGLSEAQIMMAMLAESDLVHSIDLAELNPSLDRDQQTARLMIDLCARMIARQQQSAESSEDRQLSCLPPKAAAAPQAL